MAETCAVNRCEEEAAYEYTGPEGGKVYFCRRHGELVHADSVRRIDWPWPDSRGSLQIRS